MPNCSQALTTRHLHMPFPRHNLTKFIQINTTHCKACGKCIETCPHNVLGMIALFHHTHAHVDQSKACVGCKKCVSICPQRAIQPREQSQNRSKKNLESIQTLRTKVVHLNSFKISTKWNLWMNIFTLFNGIFVFVTGLILFFNFHVGPGAFEMHSLGLERLSWINIHRLAATLFFIPCTFHILLHRKTILRKFSQIFSIRINHKLIWDIILLFSFIAATSTGFITWLLIPGSTPLLGPTNLTVLFPIRHLWIDVHNMSSLALLIVISTHLKKHWRCFFKVFICTPDACLLTETSFTLSIYFLGKYL